eukprot:TRINITY_DN7703_c0_g1_i1.p2 TRINITY_DN7703_c0_g1~~TRINITY_DN7703_c0_g1_i1.p2  ORF type:complete len:148 (+),score=49.36 TRINITY_DN7703_c0_g1_i1:65-508(+)
MSLPRMFARIAITGSTIFVKAFAEAFREAAKKGAVGAASMALPEARDILDVQKDAAPDRVLEQYRKIKEANDHTKGGSFYLESKVFCALESLAAEDKVLRREAVKEGLLAALADDTASDGEDPAPETEGSNDKKTESAGKKDSAPPS